MGISMAVGGKRGKRRSNAAKLRGRYGRAVGPARTMLEALADETATHVLSESTRLALEKIAEGFARDMNADVEFRTELRAAAVASAREVAAALRASRTRRKP